MQPRIERLEKLLGHDLFDSILWGHEYDLSKMEAGLKERIAAKHFDRIVFYGMGCSSVVSDVMKGFFKTEKLPIHVDVVNDYEVDWFIDEEILKRDKTLSIIVCYSGWSVEPCLFYDRMHELTGCKNLMVLSGGGKIAQMCERDGTSCVQYKMRHADREYPLYHVQQFFSIFLDLFHKLGLTDRDYHAELEGTVEFLKQKFDTETLTMSKRLAEKMQDSSIVFLSSAKWYGTLLKQVTMFFNEIAMTAAHRHLLHEWSHTEVAAYSNPDRKLAIVTFRDANDDDYTREKVEILKRLFADKSIPQNANVEFVNIELDQENFIQKYMFANFFAIQAAYHLSLYNDTEGRDLISRAAGNPWWSQKNIEAHPDCRAIPGQLVAEKTDYETAKAG